MRHPIFRTIHPFLIGLAVWFLLNPAFHQAVQAQPVRQLSSGEILNALHRLRPLGRVLYVGAHPDDENTALLAYLVQELGLEVAYLSLTRGSGGQNRIGPETGPLLGVLRTQELLSARRIDGAGQFFTRAVDFGYTKSRQEALSRWGETAILADVVRVIRYFQPDIVITRFAPTAGGHGHHLASAYLAEEAFRAAGDSTRFPEQLERLGPWQPRWLFWNAWPSALRNRRTARDSVFTLEIGGFNPLLGRSYPELAALSRSRHRSQAFGTSPRRGPRTEYFLLRQGRLPASQLFLVGMPVWSDLPGGEAIRQAIDRLIERFDPEHPEASIPPLVALYRQLAPLAHLPRVAQKRARVRELIRNCAGLWLAALAPRDQVAPGDSLMLTFQALNRSPASLSLKQIAIPALNWRLATANPLTSHRMVVLDTMLRVPSTLPYSGPYWLERLPREDRYVLTSPEALYQPENPPPLQAVFTVQVGSASLDFSVPVMYRWTDPVLGERFRTVQVAPELLWSVEPDVVLFPSQEPRAVELRLRSTRGKLAGVATLKLSTGWRAEPEEIPVHVSRPDEVHTLHFLIHPPAQTAVARALPVARVSGKALSYRSFDLNYEHIQPQRVYLNLPLRLSRLEISTPVPLVGYIMGSGDRIPQFLRQLGITVALLDDEVLLNGDLSRYPAIVAGIRAYNTRPVLRTAYPRLMAYVRSGGTFLVQYNTSHRLVTDSIGPYPLHLSRRRVTDETAAVTFLDRNHPALTAPNAITVRDFDGWVQERGLYFPDRWDAHYRPLLRFADPGETPLEGSLLVTRYGQGWFVYTGLSFFRQLPAGVPGAYRLFVNLISLSEAAGNQRTH